MGELWELFFAMFLYREVLRLDQYLLCVEELDPETPIFV